MWKLVAAIAAGGLLLTSAGCCWPLYDGWHHQRGGWDDRGGYGAPARPAPPPRYHPRAPAPGPYRD